MSLNLEIPTAIVFSVVKSLHFFIFMLHYLTFRGSRLMLGQASAYCGFSLWILDLMHLPSLLNYRLLNRYLPNANYDLDCTGSYEKSMCYTFCSS